MTNSKNQAIISTKCNIEVQNNFLQLTNFYLLMFDQLCHAEERKISTNLNFILKIKDMIEYQEGFHTYYVYILTNKAKTVLYTGVTNNLKIRLQQHKDSLNPNSFTAKYNVHFLLYFEKFTWIQLAIAREKGIKGWKKDKKITLIKTINPELNFLNDLFE
jgi:putative endonuclease